MFEGIVVTDILFLLFISGSGWIKGFRPEVKKKPEVQKQKRTASRSKANGGSIRTSKPKYTTSHYMKYHQNRPVNANRSSRVLKS